MPATGSCASSPIGSAFLRWSDQFRGVGMYCRAIGSADRPVDQRRHRASRRSHNARRPPPAPAPLRARPDRRRSVRRRASRWASSQWAWSQRRSRFRRPAPTTTCFDALAAGRQHDQPVEAERDAARRRHRRQARQENPRRSDRLAIDALALVHRRREAAALFGGVGQFAESVGEFDAASIELESFGETLGRSFSRASAASGAG